MPSLKAQLLRVMLKLRRRPEKVDWSTYDAVLKFRKQVEEGASRWGPLPNDIALETAEIDKLHVEWLSPQGSQDNSTVLYFHGGGYVSGTCAAHRPIVAKFVRGSGVRALLFEYRLAPENQYPAALDDALSAYRWLLAQNIPSSNIAFMGDSGGGGLCLATLLSIRDQGLPLPSGAVVLSPMTDLCCTGESHRTNLKKCLSPEGTAIAFGKHYAGECELTHPYVSPLYADLQGLPPLLMYAGGDETLRDDSVMFAKKARQAGVDVTLHVGEGMFHCYPAMAPLFPEATQALQEICSFIKLSVKS